MPDIWGITNIPTFTGRGLIIIINKMKMTYIKKIGSFSLALLIVFALGATIVLAQEETSTSANDSTSEVYKVELDESMEDDTVSDESTNTEADDEMEMTVTGEIIEIDIDTQEITIEDEEGDTQTFSLVEGFEVEDLENLSVGDEVQVDIISREEEQVIANIDLLAKELDQIEGTIVELVLGEGEEVIEVVVETEEGEELSYGLLIDQTLVERDEEMVEATTLEVGEEVIVVVSEDGEVAEEIVVQPAVGPESDAGSPIAYILIVLIIILALYALFREKK